MHVHLQRRWYCSIPGESAGFTVRLKETALQLTKDAADEGRCCLASNAVTLEDECYSPPYFLVVSCDKQSKPWAKPWANAQFGSREEYRYLSNKLAQPFKWACSLHLPVLSSTLGLIAPNSHSRILVLFFDFWSLQLHMKQMNNMTTHRLRLRKSVESCNSVWRNRLPIVIAKPTVCKPADRLDS